MLHRLLLENYLILWIPMMPQRILDIGGWNIYLRNCWQMPKMLILQQLSDFGRQRLWLYYRRRRGCNILLRDSGGGSVHSRLLLDGARLCCSGEGGWRQGWKGMWWDYQLIVHQPNWIIASIALWKACSCVPMMRMASIFSQYRAGAT